MYVLKEWQSGKEKKKFDMCMIEMETQEFMTRSIHMPKPPWTMYMSALDWLSGSTPLLTSQQGFPSVPIYTPR